MFGLSGIALAQEDEYRDKEKPLKLLDTLVRKKWITRTEIGYNVFLGEGSEKYQSTPKGLGSIKFNWVIGRRFYHRGIYIAPHLGMAIQEFRFEKNMMATGTDFVPDTLESNKYGKSKLQLISLRLPIEIGFQTRKINLAIGVFGDLLVTSKLKRKFTTSTPSVIKTDPPIENEIVSNVTNSDDLRLNTINYGVYARISYKNIGIYATYNVNKTLNISGTDLHAFQAGISFSSPIYKMRKFKLLDRLKGAKRA